jgi:uncharacterized protein
MDRQRNSAAHLSREECLDLLRTPGVARIAYSERALPAIVVVKFAVIDESIVLRIESGSRWLPSMRNAVVAFQADHGDRLDQQGWSITCVGKALPVDDPDEAAALAGSDAWSDAGDDRPAFLRMEPEMLEGRRLHSLPLAVAAVKPVAAPAS